MDASLLKAPKAKLHLWMGAHLSCNGKNNLSHTERCTLMALAVKSIIAQTIKFSSVCISYSTDEPITEELSVALEKLIEHYSPAWAAVIIQPEKLATFEHYEKIRESMILSSSNSILKLAPIDYITFLNYDCLLGTKRVEGFQLAFIKKMVEQQKVTDWSRYQIEDLPMVNKIRRQVYTDCAFFSLDVVDYVIEMYGMAVGTADCHNPSNNEYVSYIVSLEMFDQALDLTREETIKTSNEMFDYLYLSAVQMKLELKSSNLVKYRTGQISYYYRVYHCRRPGDSLVVEVLPTESPTIDGPSANKEN